MLPAHEQRLAASAAYYAYSLDVAAWEAALQAAVQGLNTPQRVRALLHADGRVEVSCTPLAADYCPSWQPVQDGAAAALPTVALALAATPKATPSLYHKTTQRQVYETAKQGAPAGVLDVLLQFLNIFTILGFPYLLITDVIQVNLCIIRFLMLWINTKSCKNSHFYSHAKDSYILSL